MARRKTSSQLGAEISDALRTSARGRDRGRIDDYVAKYMAMLEVDGERPRVVLRDDRGAAWAGRTDWSADRPRATTMEFQRRFLGDDRFLERVVAHEMVHHRNYLAGTEDERHGPSFREGAARINVVMGRDFVAERIVPPGSERALRTLAVGAVGFGLALLAGLLRRD